MSKGSMSMSQSSKAKTGSKNGIREIGPMMPAMAEDASKYSRTVSGENYSSSQYKKRKRKRITITTIIVAIAILLGGAAAALAYVGSINAKLGDGLDRSALNAALAERVAGDPFYVLLMGTDRRSGETVDRSDSIMLVRVDPGNKKAVIVSIPRDLRVNIPGYGMEKINAAHSLAGGPAGSVKAVGDFAGVDIAHYAEIDFSGFQNLVDALGGVDVEVPMEINDPDASIDGKGAGHLDAGYQTLNGEESLIFCRTRDFAIGDYQRQANQRIFLQALASKVLHADPATLTASISAIADAVTTDMDVNTILNIATSLQGMNESDIHTYTVPSSPETIDGVSYIIPDLEMWREMMRIIDSGDYPEDQPDYLAGMMGDTYRNRSDGDTSRASAGANIDRSKYGLTIRNGGGVEGSATEAAEKLKAVGYSIVDTANTNQFVYDETLIVYRSGTDSQVVSDIQATLGKGRPVQDDYTYTFDGDILIVAGADW